jgi:hypothetical protein
MPANAAARAQSASGSFFPEQRALRQIRQRFSPHCWQEKQDLQGCFFGKPSSSSSGMNTRPGNPSMHFQAMAGIPFAFVRIIRL